MDQKVAASMAQRHQSYIKSGQGVRANNSFIFLTNVQKSFYLTIGGFFMLYILLSLFACSDIAITAKPDVQNIMAFPEHIDFGHLTSGEETALEEFAVINSGQVNLTIDAPILVSGNDRFSLGEFEEEEWIIPPGEHVVFDVSYDPQTFEFNGAHIEIHSDDPDEPVVLVSLEGYGDAPVLSVTPSELNYGDISIGCDNEERITIRNAGNLPLIIENVSQLVNSPIDILMEFGSLPPPPWTIDPQTEVDFLVSYIPSDIGWDRSEIVIESNDPMLPEETIEQEGNGDVERWYSERHEQEPISYLDVLWVIDDSGSMNPYQVMLANQINFFFSAFLANNPDFHMSVITTTFPTLNGMITNATHSPEVYLASLVNVGVFGSGMEMGIEMAYQALSDPSIAGPGSQFFRDEAALVVIFVSDEPDHSGAWQGYTSFFDNLKEAGKFIPYAVIGDHPSGCVSNAHIYPINILFGAGYWHLVEHYGGDWFSLCAPDWGSQLQDLGNTLTNRATYILENENPIEDTITVTVNGQIVTEWAYDSTVNAVKFDPEHVPTEGQTIEIEYAVWGC